MKKETYIKKQAGWLTAGQIDRRQFIMSALAAGVALPSALSMADKAMGHSCSRKLGGTASLVTISLSVDYIGGARIGQWLAVDSEVLKTGSTICFVQCAVTADNDIIARANATFRAVKRK